MAHESSMFSMQHLPATQRAASPSPGAVLHPRGTALLHAFAGRSPQSTSRSAPSLYHIPILLSVCCPFCPTLLAVCTIRCASHCPVASSALSCAPVLRRPFSPLPCRWSCALRLGFSSASSYTTSPSTFSCFPVLLCAPAPLCSPPPLLVFPSHPLVTLLHLHRPPVSASPHPICLSLRTALAPCP